MHKTVEDLWRQPHIQAWFAALTKYHEDGGEFTGYGKDGFATYRHAMDDLLEEWRARSWQIVLAGRTFRGQFDSLGSVDAGYIGYLEKGEVMPPLTIKVALSQLITLFQLPIKEANVTTVDERGWRVHLYVYEQELLITAHPAAFVCF